MTIRDAYPGTSIPEMMVLITMNKAYTMAAKDDNKPMYFNR
jgi:hypothetical protein